jgi:uncharacterized phage infection (PIP) family protein YhgE
MNQVAAFALLGILSVLPSFGQASQADSQTLQAILAELRGIHNEVRLSETTHILLAELQIQQTAVDRAIQRRDDLRTKLSQVQGNQKNIAAQLAQLEETSSTTMDAAQKKRLAEIQESLKSSLANLKSEEPERSNELQEAESSLRKQQDALDSIQGRLDEVMKKLQP